MSEQAKCPECGVRMVWGHPDADNLPTVLCQECGFTQSIEPLPAPSPMPDEWETPCPKSDDSAHCNCWYDGGACCYCGDPAEQTIGAGGEQG